VAIADQARSQGGPAVPGVGRPRGPGSPGPAAASRAARQPVGCQKCA